MLLALLVGLPLVLAGIVPEGASALTDLLRAVVPFASAVELASAALYDRDPWAAVGREVGRLLVLTLVFAALARLTVRRLLI
jgi:hypothetical protein